MGSSHFCGGPSSGIRAFCSFLLFLRSLLTRTHQGRKREEEEEEEEVEEASSPGGPFVGWRRRRRRASSFCYSPEVGGWVGCPHALPPPKHGFGSDASKFSPGSQYSGLNPDSSPPLLPPPPSANSTVPEFVRRCPESRAVDSKRFVLRENAKGGKSCGVLCRVSQRLFF